MKLSHFADCGLRSLMYLAQRPGNSVATITEMAEQLKISRNHLVKVVQFLSNQEILIAQRGRGGGLQLAKEPEKLKIGQLVYLLEQKDCVIDCYKRNCNLKGSCLLKLALGKAYEDFIRSLDNHSLKDVTTGITGTLLRNLAHNYN